LGARIAPGGPNYNINPTAGKSRIGTKHNEESKELMRLANLNDKNPFYGKTHSNEFKELIRKRMLGINNPMAGKLITDLVKQTIRNTHNQSVYLYNYETKELFKVFFNQKEFIKEYNVSSKTVIKYLKSKEI
jgi:group I intron endonuclease